VEKEKERKLKEEEERKEKERKEAEAKAWEEQERERRAMEERNAQEEDERARRVAAAESRLEPVSKTGVTSENTPVLKPTPGPAVGGDPPSNLEDPASSGDDDNWKGGGCEQCAWKGMQRREAPVIGARRRRPSVHLERS
jgi:hypothetical protein